MSDTATVEKRFPVNKTQSPSELIQDTQSAIDYTMNSFSQDSALMADRTMMSDDPELNRAPASRPLKEQGTKTHADALQETSEQPSAFVEAMTNAQPETPVETQAQLIPKKETQKEYNIRVLREQKEAAERRAMELENTLKQRQQWEMSNYAKATSGQSAQYNPYNQPQQQTQDEIAISDEDLVDGRQFKKALNQVKQEYTRELQRIAAETAANAAANRLKTQFADFDRVVTEDALKNFAAIYPEEFQSMTSNKDIYAAGKTAYNMIKNFGILDMQDEPKQQQMRNNYQDQDRRIQNNMAKPRTAARVGMQGDGSTLGQLGSYGRRILTEADKEKVRQKLRDQQMYR
jgi:hypothetical protein